MHKEFDSFFYYLQKQNVYIDKSEFVFQIQSHPDYPSLLSIVDTLNFFDIESGSIHVSALELDLLPNYFIALLEGEKQDQHLCFIEKKGEDYFYLENKKTKFLSKTELTQKWLNVVLLIQESELDKVKRNNFIRLLPFLPLLFLGWLFLYNIDLKSILLFGFSIIGFLFSLFALKDLFGIKSQTIDAFCTITSNIDCETVFKSNKWTFFKIINFSDLSIVFFSTQVFGLMISIFIGESNNFLLIQNIFLYATIPAIVISLYYQKNIEKKWCSICLIIIGILLGELIYLLIINTSQRFYISFKSSLFFAFFIIIAYVWFLTKGILTSFKELKEFQLKANRFLRNYKVFKNNLLSKNKEKLLSSPIVVGNQKSKTVITVITNPFCNHCENVHKIINEILKKNSHSLQVKFLIKVNMNFESDEKKEFFRILLSLYFSHNEQIFLEALSYWFEEKDMEKWKKTYSLSNINLIEIDSTYENINDWCIINNYHYTPAIFINGYPYPAEYDRSFLPYYVNEIIEDNFFI
ncbi:MULTISPECIES: vitamin K epoxide reductase family protein [Flavobacterium]|uniref:vitamin K epoxide reductase family protein n=1 Tax=Flavobacterium TaxID=237 RepID=UPI0021148A40|nr:MULTISPECIES: vitamin K epoxide reductase family protein [Flavobacterium]UUF15759.1 hypothetical protein NLJ00_06475 [Flavobacterium panici]